ncbi:DUF4180 domain-containing protein [Natronoglycomyces albus]|uniref:DUF4180 domain-containing protein n=1 Tax=Natronoglycomyces albus TaxID=2811108 RepID=A0A895XPA5_9ACTN|nr:DUF4180 domain-containing protein [Natronoglycomyces albus]QSB04905.1 DUF4180 domain-containing protein [Natronoglycomyces albus]
MSVIEIHGFTVEYLEPTGEPITAGGAIIDLIGNASFSGVDVIAIPVSRLHQDFFDLSTRTAGEIMLKGANYGVALAVLGDIEPWRHGSAAFDDFVRESNRGTNMWFQTNREEFEARLATRPARR